MSKRKIVEALIDSINDPDTGWEYSEYRAFNKRIGCDIWLANGASHLKVSFRINNTAVDLFDAVLFPLSPWRCRLYYTAKRQQKAFLRNQELREEDILSHILSAKYRKE